MLRRRQLASNFQVDRDRMPPRIASFCSIGFDEDESRSEAVTAGDAQMDLGNSATGQPTRPPERTPGQMKVRAPSGNQYLDIDPSHAFGNTGSQRLAAGLLRSKAGRVDRRRFRGRRGASLFRRREKPINQGSAAVRDNVGDPLDLAEIASELSDHTFWSQTAGRIIGDLEALTAVRLLPQPAATFEP